jgi:hypothetical protein
MTDRTDTARARSEFVLIREVTASDWPAVWSFLREIIVAAETFSARGRHPGVVEGNERAEKLYRALGFQIVGTVPESFHHPTKGYVGLHIMYRHLT